MPIVKRFVATYVAVWVAVLGLVAKKTDGWAYRPTGEDLGYSAVFAAAPMVAYEIAVPLSGQVLRQQNIVGEVVTATAITTATMYGLWSTDEDFKEDRPQMTRVGLLGGFGVALVYGIVRRIGR